MSYAYQVKAAAAQPSSAAAPKRYALLLLGSYSAFEVISVIECLRLANSMDGAARYDWQVLSEDGKPPVSSSGVALEAGGALTDLSCRDTLIVFGGKEFVAAGTLPVLNWLRRQARMGVTIGAVNSGTYTLIKAGLLQDSEVAAHWNCRNALQETFCGLDVSHSIFSLQDTHFTCAGGVAVVDLMLQMISQEQGEAVATWVADNMVCSTPRTSRHNQVLSRSARFGDRNGKVADAVRIMQNSLECPLSPSEISERIGISTRQMERLFSKFAGMTPKAYYMKLRLEHARDLLLQTELKIIEVAMASGFNSATHFSKLYKKHFGVSPRTENKIWGSR